MFKDLEAQVKAILAVCVEYTYFMRGAIQYTDFMDLTPMEKKVVGSFLEKRMEIEGKKLHPVY
jgi:hypothetical protein